MADDARDGFRLVQVQFVEANLGAYFSDAPRLVIGPDQQMDFVAVAQQAAGEVGADEAGAAGENDSFHGNNYSGPG